MELNWSLIVNFVLAMLAGTFGVQWLRAKGYLAIVKTKIEDLDAFADVIKRAIKDDEVTDEEANEIITALKKLLKLP